MSAVVEICRVFAYSRSLSINHTDMILNLARSNGLLRTRDVDSAGAPRALLARLTLNGSLVRAGRGLYALPDRPPSEHDSIAEVAAKSSTGVICLISALRLHELTTQQSSEIWLAVPHKAHATRMDFPPLRIGASVRARLLNRARAGKIDFNLMLTRYALTRLLYRLGVSAWRVARPGHRSRFLISRSGGCPGNGAARSRHLPELFLMHTTAITAYSCKQSINID